jgi:hypothetical protein
MSDLVTRWVIVSVNANNGLTLNGPFIHEDEAETWADKNDLADRVITTIEGPL